MLFVLYKNSGVLSGRALRKTLKGLYKGSVEGGYPKRLALLRKAKGDPKTIVNLGSTEDLVFNGCVLNNREMVQAASNKRRARTVFQSADVPAPKLFLTAQAITPADFPVIGRTSYHRKGEGFWFCRTPRDVQNAVRDGATHFLEYIDNTREYRVHTFIKSSKIGSTAKERQPEDYISAKISEKVWQGKGQPNPAEPQKNHDFGWAFLGPQDRRDEELDVVRYAAKQAIASLGMDFGAVDVMYKIRDKRPYVLEVNSTPSLADDNANTCEVYAQRIMKMVGGKEED